MWAAPEGGEGNFWNSGNRVVEELDSDDTDTQGVGLANRGNRRFVSDPLQFTGTDLGRAGRSRRAYVYQPSDNSTEDDSTESSDQDTEDEEQAALREEENVLVQSALARIRKAQAKGKHDVKLNKEELAALERRRQRIQAEAAKKKAKEERVAVPLSHFDATLPPQPSQRRVAPSVSDGALPRQALQPTSSRTQPRPEPPMGVFPPPSAHRARSSHSSGRPTRDAGSSSPFDYQYVRSSPSPRHASDSTSRPPSSYRQSLPPDNRRPLGSSSSSSPRNAPDPFQYQTAGPRAPYAYGAAADRRSVPVPQDMAHASVPRRAVPAAARSSPRDESDDDTSSEDDEVDEDDSASDDLGNGVQIARNINREDEVIVVEASPSPEPERPRSKKSSSNHSPSKRKPVSSNGGGRRRKGK
jgi:PRA1 family protein 1